MALTKVIGRGLGVQGDTVAGDDAALGFTSAEGLILTGQGSTSDITVKNDADATVFTVPTGTDDILFPDNAKAMFGAGSDLQIYHDGSNSYIDDAGTGGLFIRVDDALYIRSTGNENIIFAQKDGEVRLYHNNSQQFSTSSDGVIVYGEDHAIMVSSDSGDATITSRDTSGSGSGDYGDFLFSHLRGADSDRTNSLYLKGADATVGIGTTSPAAKLNVRSNSGEIVYFQNNAGTGLKLTAGNQSFSTVSDENKKENVTELDKQKSYDNIKNIRAVNFNYKPVTIEKDEKFKIDAETIKDDKTKLGFIAQDWKTNYSEVITTDDDGTLNLSYTDTIPVLLSALQKAQEKIEALEAKVIALESA